MSQGPVILILAAGNSTRMGKAKQLLPYKGSTLVGHAIEQALASDSDQVFCILGDKANEIREAISSKEVEFLINPFPEKGLGFSIATGLGKILERLPTCPGILVLLADQPHINKEYINQLINTFNDNPQKVVASNYGQRLGVPAVFPPTVFPTLLTLEGDTGAGKWLNQEKDKVLVIPSPVSLKDIDTPEDYRSLIRK